MTKERTITREPNEAARLQNLHEYGILDTPPEPDFDALVFLASQICGVPYALISFVDADRVWYKAKVGIREHEIPRTQSFCAEAIKQKELFEVTDARHDDRFALLHAVKDKLGIRFYAGTPLLSPKGYVLGTICVLDKKPRTLTREQQHALWELSRLAIGQLELRRNDRQLKTALLEKITMEQDLQDKQQQYKNIIDSANELIYRTDANGIITFFNPAATRLLKYNHEELNGHHYLELVHPAYRKSAEKFYGVQFLRRIPSTYREVPALTKDGAVVWLGQSVHLLMENNEMAGFSIVARDITEKKLAEESITESERRLLMLMNTVSEGITFCDESGFFEVYNARMEELTGYSMNEANDVPDFNRLIYATEEGYQQAQSVSKELSVTGIARELETVIRSKFGEKKNLLVFSSLVRYKNKDMQLNVFRDVTERMKAEHAIRRSEQRFRTIFESNPLPIWVFDLDSLQFLEVNNTAIEHYGYTREEFLKMTVMEIRPAEDIEKLQTALEEISTRNSTNAEVKHRRKDGTLIDVQVSWHEFYYDSHRAVLVVAQDITESKQAHEELRHAKEEAEIANRAKSEFLANMSHEIRTPMNGILGTIDLLFATTLTDEQREYAETIRLSGDALLYVINGILDLSKIESHEIELQEIPFRIETCIEEIFELYAIQADQKGIDLDYWIDAKVAHVVMIDATRLRQVIMNLVSNAVKFTEHGEIQIVVTKTAEKEGKSELLFTVRDTGIGIPHDRLHTLFLPFSQIDSSSTRKYGGAGLGLAICARATALLGGHIWVESKLGEGSTFSFTVNVAEHHDESQDQILLPPLTSKKLKALIADDNAASLQTLKDLLGEWGLSVQQATTLEQSIDLLKSGEHFDLIIADQTLPNKSLEQIHEILRKESGRSDLPMVILASRARRDQIARTHADTLRIVLKPVRHRALYDVLAALVKQPDIVSSSEQSIKTPPEKHPAVPSMKILIAEDNTINQKLILRILKILGQEVGVTNNGLEALQSVLKKKYDVVLMDIQMPEMDGLEATRRIRKDVSPAHQPVIIAMTAHALQGDREKCIEAGMDDYLSKPILIDEVRRLLQKWYDIIFTPSEGTNL